MMWRISWDGGGGGAFVLKITGEGIREKQVTQMNLRVLGGGSESEEQKRYITRKITWWKDVVQGRTCSASGQKFSFFNLVRLFQRISECVWSGADPNKNLDLSNLDVD